MASDDKGYAEKLGEYISASYNRWVGYAWHYVIRSKLPLDAHEIVNEVLCSLLESSRGALEAMMMRGAHEVDAYVKYIIKMGIYSPRSQFRYCRRSTLAPPPNQQQEVREEDCYGNSADEVRDDLLQALDEVRATDFERRVFEWKLDGKPASGWEGRESRRKFTQTYKKLARRVKNVKL